MTEYKEGDSEVTKEVSEQQEMTPIPVESLPEEPSTLPAQPKLTPVPDGTAAEPPVEGVPDRTAVTAVLLIQFEDGRVDAITDLPSLEKGHVASIREVRNMCASIASDMDNLLTVKMFSQEMQMQAARAQMQRQLDAAQKSIMTPQQMQAMASRNMRIPRT
jgi:hypothetical protein